MARPLEVEYSLGPLISLVNVMGYYWDLSKTAVTGKLIVLPEIWRYSRIKCRSPIFLSELNSRNFE